jgi:hypothetical protein
VLAHLVADRAANGRVGKRLERSASAWIKHRGGVHQADDADREKIILV